MKKTGHLIGNVLKGSIADEMQIEAGDWLLAIDGQEIEDIFDYRFLMQENELEILIRKKNGEEWLLDVEKEEDEEFGIAFENEFMDDYKSCCNRCIFCFIDQMPEGMRDTLYFKDDDSRLSFLQGNYVTLTNMSEKDIDRIIRYRLEPINISFQTTNPKLRCEMLQNKFAGEALHKADRLLEAGIIMNGQIVLCKGINDGDELERTISDLEKYLPYLESISVVPAGLTQFRKGLYPLEPFQAQDAKEVIEQIHGWQRYFMGKYNIHFVHASDEWYILASKDLPAKESYDGYLQLENGVGMLRLFLDEFDEAISGLQHASIKEGSCSIATGALAYPYILAMAERLMKKNNCLHIEVYRIVNYYFGEQITVSGLLTGKDLLEQLTGRVLGERLLLPENMLRSGETVFLDDMTVAQLEKALQVEVDIVKSSGADFVRAVCRTGE